MVLPTNTLKSTKSKVNTFLPNTSDLMEMLKVIESEIASSKTELQNQIRDLRDDNSLILNRLTTNEDDHSTMKYT